MKLDALQTILAAAEGLASGGPLWGKAAFVSVFALLLVWLVLMPGRLIGQGDRRPPWWRNTRLWAIAIAAVQIVVYLRWG